MQLAISIEKLAQSAEQLADVTIRNSQASERREETLKTPKPSRDDETADEEDANLAVSQQREVLDVPDLTAPEGTNATDFKAPGEYPVMLDQPKDE